MVPLMLLTCWGSVGSAVSLTEQIEEIHPYIYSHVTLSAMTSIINKHCNSLCFSFLPNVFLFSSYVTQKWRETEMYLRRQIHFKAFTLCTHYYLCSVRKTNRVSKVQPDAGSPGCWRPKRWRSRSKADESAGCWLRARLNQHSLLHCSYSTSACVLCSSQSLSHRCGISGNY